MTDRGASPNEFEQDKPGTQDRTRSEAMIEGVRQLGGVFVDAIRASRLPMVLTDPNLPGNPIVFANDAFLRLSGYSMEDVLGQQPHFLNGPDTDPKDAARFRQILIDDRDEAVETVQYAKDGRRFVATVLLSAFNDAEGRTLHRFLSWTDVTRRVDAEGDAADLRATQAALRESEAKFRTLFESIDEGFCLIEYVDDPHRSSDYRFLEVNAAFEKLTGVTGAVGKLLSEVSPDSENYWRETYAEVARTGVARRIEDHHEETGRWYDVFVSRVGGQGSRRICLVFTDTTERKHAEAALRESEERQAFLLKLSDALRPDMKADAVGALATRMVAEHLGVDRCYVARFSREEEKGWVGPEFRSSGLPALTGEYPFAAFPEIITRMETRPLVIRDGFTDPSLSEADRQSYRAIGLRAVLTAPLRRGEGNVVWFLTAAATQPRDWADGELKLLEDVAERTWAAIERARAEALLCEGEERQAFLLKLADALRPLANPADIQGEITRLLREQMNAGWCYYVDWDSDEKIGRVLRDSAGGGLPSLAGAHDVADAPEFLQLQAAGAVLTVRDYAGYEQLPVRIRKNFALLGFQSMMAAPLVKDGRLIASLIVGDTEIRDWSECEASLLGEVTERTWEAIERARAEAALRESDARLAELADAAHVLIWETDESGAVFVNSHYLAYFGVGFDEIAGIGWMRFVHPNDIDEYTAAYSQAFAERRPFDHECRLLRADGQYRWHRNSGRPASEGHFIGSSADIHDLMMSEQALRANEERLRQFGEAAQDVLWIRDAETLQWTYFTPAFEAIYGIAREEALEGDNYRNWLDLVLPEDRDHAKACTDKVRSGESLTFEYRIRRPDGEIRWLRDTDFPIRDAAGNVVLFGGIGQDVTSLKRLETARSESEERLRLIVENAQDYAIFTTDREGLCTDWREGAEAVFGYSRDEAIGLDMDILFTPEDRETGEPDKERATAATQGKAPDVRWHMRKGGVRVFIDGVSTALRNSDGTLIGFLKIGQDTTERHAGEERQKLLLAELQHRVRNTLGMIRSMVRFTAEGHDDIEDYLSHLTGRLDSLSRTQQLLTRSSEARVDLHELVSEEMTAQAGGRAAYALDGPPVLLAPKAAEVLSLALHELVTNSVKYGALGEVRNYGTQVNVGWNVTQRDGQNWLDLRWRERASALVPSGRRGFGTELITQRVPYELRGEASLDIGENEVNAHIAFPLANGPSSLLETGAPRVTAP